MPETEASTVIIRSGTPDEAASPIIQLKRPTGASLHRHRSDQEIGTPLDFIAAVEERFGPLTWDLAASAENTKAPNYFTRAVDSLKQDWTVLSGNLWLNPEFAQIDPWASKCRETRAQAPKQRILMLTPGSVGTNWFAEHVHLHALILGLRPRIKFVGAKDAYPKDLTLSVYGEAPGFDCWRWK